MATGIDNEKEYVRIFNSFYTKRKNKDVPTAVVFEETPGKRIVLKNVTKMERIGQRGLKTDIVVHYQVNGQLRKYKISIKDHTSIYWGSEDRYIRQTLGNEVRESLKAQAGEGVVVYDARQRRYKLLAPIGMEVNKRAQTKTIFGVEQLYQRTNQNDYQYCDVVIRGEIEESVMVQKNFKENILTYQVERIYKDLSDVPDEETPVLYIYSNDGKRPRQTFNEVDLNIQEFSGIRGAFRSKKHVEENLGYAGGIVLL